MSSRKTDLLRIVAVAAAVLALLVVMALVVAPSGVAQANPNPGVLPPDSNTFGRTYAEWSVAWWQWAFGTPYSQSAWTDETGARCGVGQSGHVWFLAGVANASGTVTRDCTVPSETALFVPILNVEWDQEDAPLNKQRVPVPYSEAELRQIAASIIDATAGLFITVDGAPVTLTDAYRIKSAPFTYTMSATDNSYGLTCTGTTAPVCTILDGRKVRTVPFPGLTCTGGPNSMCTAGPVDAYHPGAVGDGYYVMLAPLSAGQHTVHFGGTFTDWGYTLNITYHLTVGH